MKHSIQQLFIVTSMLVFTSLLPGTETYCQQEQFTPFTIEIHPDTVLIGDPIYIKITQKNTTDFDAYAKDREISFVDAEHKLVTFYFEQLDKTLLSWNTGRAPESEAGSLTNWWKLIKPGENGLTLYTGLGFPGFVYDVRFLDIICCGFEKDEKWWKQIQKDAIADKAVYGHLVIQQHKRESLFGPLKQPPAVRYEYCPTKITIKPRKKGELSAISKFYSSDTFREVSNNMNIQGDVDKSRSLYKEFDSIIRRTSPGTLRNLLQTRYLLLKLHVDISEADWMWISP